MQVQVQGGAQQLLTFLEDLRPVDPHQAGVGIFVFLAVAHVGQLIDQQVTAGRREGGLLLMVDVDSE